MEEQQGGVCVACGGEAPKLSEAGKCDMCSGGGNSMAEEIPAPQGGDTPESV